MVCTGYNYCKTMMTNAIVNKLRRKINDTIPSLKYSQLNLRICLNFNGCVYKFIFVIFAQIPESKDIIAVCDIDV